MSQKQEKHIIIARVDNKPGVVSRIAGLFTRRGYNIESLVTGTTENPDVYHMTITVLCTSDECELLIHQLGRVMEVIEVCDAVGDGFVCGELMYVKTACPSEKRAEILKIADVLGVKIAGVTKDAVVCEVTGDDLRLKSVIMALEPYGIIRIIRSGAITIEL